MGEPDAGISIVIPVFQATPKLHRLLWNIEETTDLPYELIVSESKSCVAINRNRGLAKSTCDRVVFMDDDVLLPPFWSSLMVNALENIPDAGVIAPQMVGPAGEVQNGLANIARDECLQCVPPGTLFVYRKSQLPGCAFDERYIASQWEDTDFMMQVRALGKSCWAIGCVRIIHDNAWTEHTGSTWESNKSLFQSKWGEPNLAEQSCQKS